MARRKNIQIIDKSKDESLSVDYWMHKTVEERLTALQILREQYRRAFKKGQVHRESRKRLRRFYRVAKQT